MRKIFWSIVTIMSVFAFYTLVAHPDWVVLPTFPKAFAQSSEKMDTSCTGHETAGRCADKCPNQTDTLLGYDPQTGAAICKAAPTGCPYGDSIPLDSPKCAAPMSTPESSMSTPMSTNFEGK